MSIIELLVKEEGEMQLGELATKLNLPKSGVHRLLGALIAQGWVEQDAQTSAYRLTMRLTILGQSLYNSTGIPDICQPLLDSLARETQEFVRLAVIDAHALVWVADAQGARGGLMYQPRLTTNTVPLHATASGKSWLAKLPRTQVHELIAQNGGFGEPGQFGPNAVHSFDALFEELERTRERGFGTAFSEAEPGVTAVAAAFRSGTSGPPVGTISVAGPTIRMGEMRVAELSRLVIRCAQDLSAIWPIRRRQRFVRQPTSSAA
ncbi:IclR family transcriptional regulator [Bosea sp. (in: a-proteobacteria)]|uniref:IclR family transcriptional regulator n=1 Tax=Bosea sp. (in: a-proteobacteria) TaxID=1871050 RepID=UPI00261AA3B4|nr:IclR family transcriptional regulator [Bosea sp. (in: a-proteobacteria)]MCO5090344.1 IclR family transcriptional regulator [Bosea sp. (in: a-proteobacteria)]